MPEIGDVVPFAVEIRDPDGVLSNASTITLSVIEPDGTVQSVFVANPPAVVGRYTADFTPTQLGRHQFHWVSAGPQAAYEDIFDIRAPSGRSILSLIDAKKHLNIPLTDSNEDDELMQMMEAATYAIERHRDETIPVTTYTEELVGGSSTGRVQLDHRPLISVVSVNGDTTPGYTLNKPLAQIYGPYLAAGSTIVYRAGFPVIPANYILAAKIVLAHLWQTQRMTSLGQNQGFGLRTQQVQEQIMTPAGLGTALPHRAVELLGARPSMIV